MWGRRRAAGGGFLRVAVRRGLDRTHKPNRLTMLGVVIRIGSVVNNAILIVHQALNYMRGVGEGVVWKVCSFGRACSVEASAVRLGYICSSIRVEGAV